MATSASRRGSLFLLLAILFFVIGILVILKTAGLISANVYARLMTWQALTVGIGVFLLCTREVVVGAITVVLGVIAMFNFFNLLTIVSIPGLLLILGAVMMIYYLRR